MYSATVVTDGAFQVRAATPLFVAPLAGGVPGPRPWHVTADGQRFLMSVPIASQTTQSPVTPAEPITVVLNWTTRLRRGE
jgi:hypothetical protein